MKCDTVGKLAPVRVHWVKALRSGVGMVPSDSVSVMESLIQLMRALLSDVRLTLYCV